jgi:hypothetical protein
MPTEIVTSFSPTGAELYGRRCVASIKAYWPHPVTVYTDALDVTTTRLTGDIPCWSATKARLPETRPDVPAGGDKWTQKPTSYLWNARKFAVKPFVWKDAAERLGSGLLVWLDGDTVTTAPVPDGLIKDVMDGVDVAFLGRGAMHPETGFVAFRVPEALPMLRWCVEAYRLGGFLALNDGWTDCHVLRAGLSAVGAKARDLTSPLALDWRSSVNAFALSPLGPYVEHLKGGKVAA